MLRRYVSAVAAATLGGLAMTGCSGAPPSGPDLAEAGAGTSRTGSTTARSAAVRTVATKAAAAKKIVVVLDPGHNGGNAAHPEVINKLVPAGGFKKPCNTTGTATNSGYSEHAFTWDVAKRTARILRKHGVTVVFTRKTDTGVGPCVNKRAAIGNKKKADLVVSIHGDGASSGVRGYHVIEPALSPDKKNRKILKPSAVAARDLLAAFGKATKEPRARYPGAKVKPGLTKRNDLAGLNLSRVPAVFIECANLRNAKDAAKVRSAAWRQKAARGIADGILAYVR